MTEPITDRGATTRPHAARAAALAFALVAGGALAVACSSGSDSGSDGFDGGTTASTKDGGGGAAARDAGLPGDGSTGSALGGDATDGAGDGAGADPSCGCHGQAGCAVWTDVYTTFYGFNDNSCAVESDHDCNNIAFPGLGPKKHTGAAEGAGTYDDPITAAASDQGDETSGGVALKPGTIVYNPNVQKYFIMEDSCLECGDERNCKVSADNTSGDKPPASCKPSTNLHIDFWMGPSATQNAKDLDDCEGNSTLGSAYAGAATIVVNPPADLPVKATKLYSGTGAGGGCWTTGQASAATCP